MKKTPKYPGIYRDDDAPEVPKLALRPAAAAKAISVSEKTLWSLTEPRGPIRCLRPAKGVVLYSVDVLREWLKGDSQDEEVPTDD